MPDVSFAKVVANTSGSSAHPHLKYEVQDQEPFGEVERADILPANEIFQIEKKTMSNGSSIILLYI